MQRLRELEGLTGGQGAAERSEGAVAPTMGGAPTETWTPLEAPQAQRETRPETLDAAQQQPRTEVEQPSDAVHPYAGLDSRRTRAARHRSGRALPRRIRLLWVLSVVASGAVAAGITYAMVSISPVSAGSGAQQIATLTPSTVVEIPAGWFGAGPSSVAYEYFGLTLFESGAGYGGAGSECFTAVATEQLPVPDVDVNSWSLNGPVLTGCRVGSFPATVQMLVDSGAPEEMRSRFPSRTALQFVLDDERMGVFLSGE